MESEVPEVGQQSKGGRGVPPEERRELATLFQRVCGEREETAFRDG